MKKTLFVLSLLYIVCANSIAGDILVLTNGLAFEGKVVRVKKCEIVFKAHGYKYIIPGADINSIQFANPQDQVYLNFIEGPQGDACIRGAADAQALHGKKAGHFFLGFLFGPFAMIGTALSSASPVRGRDTMLLSQNKELFSNPEYLSCYRKKAKGQLIGMEAAGFGAWLLLYLISNASGN
jgi:hypothetical protein